MIPRDRLSEATALHKNEICSANFPYENLQSCPFFSQLRGGFARIDRRGCIRQCNPTFAEMFDEPSFKAMVGRCLLRYLPQDRIREITQAEWKQNLGRASMSEIEIVTRLGNYKWLQIWFAPRFNDQSALAGILVVTLDITEKKQLELRNEMFRTAAESVGEAIVITDASGRIEFVNKSFQMTTGYSRDEAIGANPSILKSGQHDDVFYQRLWSQIRSGQVWHGRFINRRKDGSIYYEDGTIAPIHNSKNEIVKFVAVKRDVTEEILSEERIRHTEKMKAIGVLAAGVAHDFNNILTSIIGYASLLLERNTSEKEPQTHLLEGVLHEAERAAKVCNQLLSFSRSDDDKTEIFDLTMFVKNEADVLKRIIGEGVELSISLPTEEVLIRMTPGKMYQVMMNLVLNARDAMPDGGKIELWVDTTGDRALFGCTDNGIGITNEIADRVFEPFFTTKEVGKGTGLGLSLCYNIVTEVNGIIAIDSIPGKGTTFVIELPLIPANPLTPEPDPVPELTKS